MLNWMAIVEITITLIQYKTLVGVTIVTIFDNASTSEDVDNQIVGILALTSCFEEMPECFLYFIVRRIFQVIFVVWATVCRVVVFR